MKNLLIAGLLFPLLGCAVTAEPQAVTRASVTAGTTITEIVAEMANQIMANDNSSFGDVPVTVTSFVDLDTLEDTNWLGQQIAESFIHELHQRGLSVLEFKATGNIKVTKQGDYVFSRDWKALRKRIPVYRILTGTMSKAENGVLLNARIINMQTQLVEATAQGHVPNELLYGGLNSLGPAYRSQGLLIRRGQKNGQGHFVELTH